MKLFIRDKLRISITNACNFSCFYCHNEGQGHDKNCEFMKLSEFSKIINFIKRNKIEIHEFNITGGEPTLHPDLLEFVKMAAEVSDDIRVNTNGSLLNEDFVDKLKNAGATQIKIGVDYFFTKQSKPNLVSNGFDMSKLNVIMKYIASKMELVVNAVVMKSNVQDMPEFLRKCSDIGAIKVNVIELQDFDSMKTNCDSCIDSKHKTCSEHSEIAYKKLLNYFINDNDTQRVEYETFRGVTKVFLKNGTLLKFGEDICRTKACGNMFTLFNSNMEFVICQKSERAVPIDFSKPDDLIIKLIKECNGKYCTQTK